MEKNPDTSLEIKSKLNLRMWIIHVLNEDYF